MSQLEGLALPERYGSFAGAEAYQCSVCHGIAYSQGGPCPYCADDEDDDE